MNVFPRYPSSFINMIGTNRKALLNRTRFKSSGFLPFLRCNFWFISVGITAYHGSGDRASVCKARWGAAGIHTCHGSPCHESWRPAE